MDRRSKHPKKRRNLVHFTPQHKTVSAIAKSIPKTRTFLVLLSASRPTALRAFWYISSYSGQSYHDPLIADSTISY